MTQKRELPVARREPSGGICPKALLFFGLDTCFKQNGMPISETYLCTSAQDDFEVSWGSLST